MAHLRFPPEIQPDGTARLRIMENHLRYDLVAHPGGGLEFAPTKGVRDLALKHIPAAVDRAMPPRSLAMWEAVPGIRDVVVEHVTGCSWVARYDGVIYVVTVTGMETANRDNPPVATDIGGRALPIPVYEAVVRERAHAYMAQLKRQANPVERVRLKAPPRRRAKTVEAIAASPVEQPQKASVGFFKAFLSTPKEDGDAR